MNAVILKFDIMVCNQPNVPLHSSGTLAGCQHTDAALPEQVKSRFVRTIFSNLRQYGVKQRHWDRTLILQCMLTVEVHVWLKCLISAVCPASSCSL